MPFKILSKEEFQHHISHAPYKSFLQSLEMAELLTKRGFTVTFVGWVEKNDIKISALLYSKPMTGGLMMEINSGPVSTDDTYLTDFYRALQTYAKENGVLELRVKPYDSYQIFDSNGQATSDEQTQLITQLTDLGYSHDGLMTGYPGGEPDWHYVKDLSGLTSEKLLSSFSKKGKPLIKKAKSFGTQIRPLKREELQIFKDITSSTSDRRQYTDKSLEYYQDFYDSFGDKAEFMIASINFETYLFNLAKDQAKLKTKIDKLVADLEKKNASEKKKNQLRELSSQFDTFTIRISEAKEFLTRYGKEDVPLAASLFIYTPQESYYLFSGSYTEFNKFYAPALLQEHAMLKSIDQGISTYNFLGIMGIFDNSDGVLRFKQNFNGYVTRKMGTFRYYPSPIKFKVIQTLKKLLRR